VWNCDGGPPPPLPADANPSAANWDWTWIWNGNCAPGGSAPAGGASGATDGDQYQAGSGQYLPTNTNIEIRILSPGDSGSVTQTNSAITQVISTATNAVEQQVEQQHAQIQAAAAQVQPENVNVGISIASPGDSGPVTQVNEAVAQIVATTIASATQSAEQTTAAIGSTTGQTLETAVPALGSVGQTFDAAQDALVAAGAPGVAQVVAAAQQSVAAAVTEVTAAVGKAIAQVTKAVQSGIGVAAPRVNTPRATPKRVAKRPTRPIFRPPTGDITIFAATTTNPLAWTSARVTRAGASAPARSASGRAAAPQRPEPFGPWPYGTQVSSAGTSLLPGGSVLLGFVAALLASFLLVPPNPAVRIRAPGDRRRLRPRPDHRDKPG
jgi:hypothetical protein